ncbi:sporulation protein YabP [Alicyclobacillus macrosporangiidus]|uniref:sporulation protein YabP n=1 Tax=Alicyclobacillus macrosporangiidus TaxID=392015 RepID=UPI000496D4C6|nr:sporulation protein YabP [Alicyclobacillus macrosporangiidus]MCL6599336.1 sporulation protein YabP [Alicyclobacillus macrosporangiidus]
MASAEPHDISIKGRKWVQVTGVSSVESFDAHAFSLVTSAGPLTIQGTNLHMKHLDLDQGVVEIEGTVSNLTYVSEQAQKKRVVGRLFR